jgi:hypothetical protein
MTDNLEERAERAAKTLKSGMVVVAIIVGLLWFGIVYIVLHFVIKYW